MLRVVLDTNVFVSSLLSKTGTPSKLLDAWRDGKYLLVTSPFIITEIRQVLESPRIAVKYNITPEDTDQLINLLEKDALVTPGLSDVKGSIPGDPKDEMFFACALEAGADCIVSGDRHLLDLRAYKEIPVLNVQQFAETLSKAETEKNHK